MSPLAPSQRKRIPLLAAGTVAALSFAVWNIHRAIEPPLRSIPKQASLERVSAEVERSLPVPSSEAPPTTVEGIPPAGSSSRAAAVVPTAEENLSPEVNPFVPLPGGVQAGEQYVEAATPAYNGMQMPPPAYIPRSPTLMRLATSTVTPPRQSEIAGPPVVSIRSAAPHTGSAHAPALPAAGPLPAPVAPAPGCGPGSASAPAAKPETPPSLIGTLLGDQPSAVFMVDGNITIVPAGGVVAGWQLLKVDHGGATLKSLATGLKIPVMAAAEGASSGG